MTQQELIQQLNSLLKGHYICDKESEDDVYLYQVIGSDEIYTNEDMTKDCYDEYCPLLNIKLI